MSTLLDCRHCDGNGYIVDDDSVVHYSDGYAEATRTETCEACDGTGKAAPVCLCCEGPLVNGFCGDCGEPIGLTSRRIQPGEAWWRI